MHHESKKNTNQQKESIATCFSRKFNKIPGYFPAAKFPQWVPIYVNSCQKRDE